MLEKALCKVIEGVGGFAEGWVEASCVIMNQEYEGDEEKAFMTKWVYSF